MDYSYPKFLELSTMAISMFILKYKNIFEFEVRMIIVNVLCNYFNVYEHIITENGIEEISKLGNFDIQTCCYDILNKDISDFNKVIKHYLPENISLNIDRIFDISIENNKKFIDITKDKVERIIKIEQDKGNLEVIKTMENLSNAVSLYTAYTPSYVRKVLNGLGYKKIKGQPITLFERVDKLENDIEEIQESIKINKEVIDSSICKINDELDNQNIIITGLKNEIKILNEMVNDANKKYEEVKSELEIVTDKYQKYKKYENMNIDSIIRENELCKKRISELTEQLHIVEQNRKEYSKINDETLQFLETCKEIIKSYVSEYGENDAVRRLNESIFNR